jgi:hypothetical protein
MRDSTGRELEWCYARDYACPCEFSDISVEPLPLSVYKYPETKCPDLGDWSDTPHDQLDGELKTDSEYRHPMADVLESILTSADW